MELQIQNNHSQIIVTMSKGSSYNFSIFNLCFLPTSTLKLFLKITITFMFETGEVNVSST